MNHMKKVKRILVLALCMAYMATAHAETGMALSIARLPHM
jgi:hypothetical protein